MLPYILKKYHIVVLYQITVNGYVIYSKVACGWPGNRGQKQVGRRHRWTKEWSHQVAD